MKNSFKFWLFVSFWASLLAPAGAALAAEKADEHLIATGRALVERNCSGCHAIGQTGESPNPLSPPFRTLSAKYPLDSLEEAFAEGISVGHAEMPQFELEPSQVAALIAYLKSVQPPHGKQ